MKALIVMLVFAVTLMSCSFKETNDMIATSNATRFTAFTQGMNSAQSEGARIAIAMAYANNMGMQDFFRPEGGVDYLRAGLPWFTLGTGIWMGNKDEGGDRINAGNDVFISSSKQDSWSIPLPVEGD